MRDEDKTKQQLINELVEMRQRIAELESEKKYRHLVENISDVVYTVDKDGVLTYVSPAIESLSGYIPSDLIGRSLTELIHQEDLPLMIEALQRSIASDHIEEPSEYRYVTKSGEIRWVRVSGRPVFMGDRLVGFQGVVTDITERKRAEEAIRKLSQFRESIIDNANVWIDVLDEKANVLVWNKAAEEISGYSRHEVVGHDKIWEWLYPDEEYRNEIIERVTTFAEREDTETTIRCKDGQTRIISWNSRNLVDERGVMMGSIAIGRDITQRRQAETERTQPAEVETNAFITMCASCKKIRYEKDHWHPIEAYMLDHHIRISHGICPECAQELYPDFLRDDE